MKNVIVKVGSRFGKIEILEVLTASEVGHPRDGAWARCRCECGKRVLRRVRHIRQSARQKRNTSCGCQTPFGLRLAQSVRALRLGAA